MSKKILLVEDDMFTRELYESELKRAGYEIVACPSGEEGIIASRQSKFDLVLLDIMLPGLNGLEVLKQIKQNSQTKDLKVVLLSNLGHEVSIKKGFELGAFGYLIKSSYNPDQIIAKIAVFLRNNSSETKHIPTSDVGS